MSFIGQVVSVAHFSPTITVSIAVTLACRLVAHRTVNECEPSLSVVGAVNLNGGTASVAFCAPSTAKSTSWMPSPDVHVTSTSNPACTAVAAAGDVIGRVGAAAPAGPNGA